MRRGMRTWFDMRCMKIINSLVSPIPNFRGSIKAAFLQTSLVWISDRYYAVQIKRM